jgi:hypothetical protein
MKQTQREELRDYVGETNDSFRKALIETFKKL